MQQIRVQYNNGVFVPLEHIEPGLYKDAVATIAILKDKVAGKKDINLCRKKAKEFFQKSFPGKELNGRVTNLIGILYQEGETYSQKQCEKEYKKYLWRKYQ